MNMGSNTNSFLKKIDQAKQDCFVAGCDITAQQMFDMMCLVLNNPNVMGKYRTIGAEQLKKIHVALFETESMYHDAWMFTPESDYLQEKLDANLKEIFGEIDPFQKRYPLCRQWNYMKPYKEKK
jgi:hypothetical protein